MNFWNNFFFRRPWWTKACCPNHCQTYVILRDLTEPPGSGECSHPTPTLRTSRREAREKKGARKGKRREWLDGERMVVWVRGRGVMRAWILWRIPVQIIQHRWSLIFNQNAFLKITSYCLNLKTSSFSDDKLLWYFKVFKIKLIFIILKLKWKLFCYNLIIIYI